MCYITVTFNVFMCIVFFILAVVNRKVRTPTPTKTKEYVMLGIYMMNINIVIVLEKKAHVILCPGQNTHLLILFYFRL